MDRDKEELPPLADAQDVDTRCQNLIDGTHPIADIDFVDDYDGEYLNFSLTASKVSMNGHIRFFGSPKAGEITILDPGVGKVGYVYLYNADTKGFQMPRGPGTLDTMPQKYAPARYALNYLYAGQ